MLFKAVEAEAKRAASSGCSSARKRISTHRSCSKARLHQGRDGLFRHAGRPVMVAVAIGAAAVLGAGASIISGNKAAKAQEQGDADQSIAEAAPPI
jgi:hypothetical protein